MFVVISPHSDSLPIRYVSVDERILSDKDIVHKYRSRQIGSTEKCVFEEIHALSGQKLSSDWKFHFQSIVNIVRTDREYSTRRRGSVEIDRSSVIELLSPWSPTVTISRLVWKRDQYEGFDSSHIQVDSSAMEFGSRRRMFSSNATVQWNSSEEESPVVPTIDREMPSLQWRRGDATWVHRVR